MGLIDSLPGTFSPLDSYGARPTIDMSHHKIHQGLHWNTSTYFTGNTAFNVLITAPSDVHYHFIAEVACTGPGTMTWSKAPGFDATGGSAITAYNNNEDSTNTSTLTHVKGGTYTSSGTILATFLIGNSTGTVGQPVRVGGSEQHAHEWELGYSSVHLLRLVPSASCEAVIRTYFYRKE